MPQTASRLQGFWEIRAQNLGDDTAEKEVNPMKIKHLPIIQRALSSSINFPAGIKSNSVLLISYANFRVFYVIYKKEPDTADKQYP